MKKEQQSQRKIFRVGAASMALATLLGVFPVNAIEVLAEEQSVEAEQALIELPRPETARNKRFPHGVTLTAHEY